MASRGNDKGFFASKANKFERGDWLDNQDVCQMLNISPRPLQTLRDNGTLAYSQINRKVYYKPEDVESILHVVAGRDKKGKMCNPKTSRLCEATLLLRLGIAKHLYQYNSEAHTQRCKHSLSTVDWYF